jgi:uncharacterized coiled-coil protein SlyX
MKDELLTVKELAEAANISVQSIYKRLKNENDVIHDYVVVQGGKQLIKVSVLENVYNIKDNQQQDSGGNTDFAEIISVLKSQLDIKDKQIKELNDIIKENNKLIDQQQQLHLLDKKKILALEEASAASTEKRSIFNIFRKREKR